MEKKRHGGGTTGSGVGGKLFSVFLAIAILVKEKRAEIVPANRDDVSERPSFGGFSGAIAIDRKMLQFFRGGEAFERLHKFRHTLADTAKNRFSRAGNVRIDRRNGRFEFAWRPKISTSGSSSQGRRQQCVCAGNRRAFV